MEPEQRLIVMQTELKTLRALNSEARVIMDLIRDRARLTDQDRQRIQEWIRKAKDVKDS